MPNYTTFQGLFKGIADAIRTKDGTVASIAPLDFPSRISALGGVNIFKSLVEKTITSYSNSSITYIGSYAFHDCNNLSQVDIPNCISIDVNAFNNTTRLRSASFPNCTTLSVHAFKNCFSLISVYMPNVTIIPFGAFYSCVRLTDIDITYCSQIQSDAFKECYTLSTISLPNCIFISDTAFCSCSNLISVYLMGSSVVQLEGSMVFSSTPIGGYSAVAGQYGSIYVPMSLLADYQTDTSWSLYSDRLVGV